jgi:hypothetical protein
VRQNAAARAPPMSAENKQTTGSRITWLYFIAVQPDEDAD